MAARLSRSERRAQETDVTRLRMLEDDADISDVRHDRIENKLNAILMLAVGGTAAFATSSVLLAVNIARGG